MLTTKGSGTRAHSLYAAMCMTAMATIANGDSSHRISAVLVAKESSLHTSVANRDAYLLRILPRRGAAFDAIAIDSYPGYADALPLRDMPKDVRFSVKLLRTPYCDRSEDEGQKVLRCFAIERKSLKIRHTGATDQWWR
jgi:hypothetical protein